MLEKGARKIFCNALVTKLNLSSDFPEFRYVGSGLSAHTIHNLAIVPKYIYWRSTVHLDSELSGLYHIKFHIITQAQLESSS
jgi:hypothetical protein